MVLEFVLNLLFGRQYQSLVSFILFVGSLRPGNISPPNLVFCGPSVRWTFGLAYRFGHSLSPKHKSRQFFFFYCKIVLDRLPNQRSSFTPNALSLSLSHLPTTDINHLSSNLFDLQTEPLERHLISSVRRLKRQRSPAIYFHDNLFFKYPGNPGSSTYLGDHVSRPYRTIRGPVRSIAPRTKHR